jgi:hypothetical protein
VRAAAAQLARDRWNRDVSLAWYTAAFTRQEKLQPLKSLLARADRGQRQRPEAMVEALEQIAGQFGLRVHTTRKGES